MEETQNIRQKISDYYQLSTTSSIPSVVSNVEPHTLRTRADAKNLINYYNGVKVRKQSGIAKGDNCYDNYLTNTTTCDSNSSGRRNYYVDDTKELCDAVNAVGRFGNLLSNNITIKSRNMPIEVMKPASKPKHTTDYSKFINNYPSTKTRTGSSNGSSRSGSGRHSSNSANKEAVVINSHLSTDVQNMPARDIVTVNRDNRVVLNSLETTSLYGSDSINGSVHTHQRSHSHQHQLPATNNAMIVREMNRYKDRYLKKYKQQLNAMNQKVEEEKEEVRSNFTYKVNVMKQIHAFRQQILKRLNEKNDTLSSSFMRYFSDSVALEFLNRYNSYSMTIDAIIALIGHTLTSNSDVKFNDTRYAVTVPLTILESDSNANDAYDGDDVYNDINDVKTNDKTIRATARNPIVIHTSGNHWHKHELPTSIELSTSIIDFNSSTGSLERGTSSRLKARTSDASTYGGGFSRETRGANTHSSNAYRHSNSDDVFNSYGDDGDDGNSQTAVDLIRKQLADESMLPSLYPVAVLSEDHLHRLGTRKIDFDDIVKSMKWKEKQLKIKEDRDRMSNSNADINMNATSTAAVIERVSFLPKHHAPIALPSNASIITSDTVAVSPYAEPIGAVSEKTKVSASGIPSSSGLRLYSKNKTIARKTRNDGI